MKILVLDDNPDALNVIKTFLATLGHHVEPFLDGQEALSQIGRFKPEAVIADLDMPVMDGYDFIKRLQGDPDLARIPVICITGTAATDDQIAAGGFAATIRKPASLSDLIAAIEQVQIEPPESSSGNP